MFIDKHILLVGILLVFCFTIIDMQLVNAITYFPPYKQLRVGVGIKDITCDANSHVILKKISFLPVCVKQETAMKLIERGWGITIESFNSSLNHALTLVTDKELYNKGENVKIAITNTSNKTLFFYGWSSRNTDLNVLVCCNYMTSANVRQVELNMSSTLKWEWNPLNLTDSSQLKTGNYTISVSYGLPSARMNNEKTISVEIR